MYDVNTQGVDEHVINVHYYYYYYYYYYYPKAFVLYCSLDLTELSTSFQ